MKDAAFSVEENRQHLRSFHFGIPVCKARGVARTTNENPLAARAEGCIMIVVSRSPLRMQEYYTDVGRLLCGLLERIEMYY